MDASSEGLAAAVSALGQSQTADQLTALHLDPTALAA